MSKRETLSVLCAIHPTYNQDAGFIQAIHRKRDKTACKYVRRSYKSSNDGNEDEGMTAVTLHKSSLKQAHLGKEEREDWYLEDKSHEQRQRSERGNIRREAYLVHDIRHHLISAEKTQRKRKQHIITHQHAEHEEYIYSHGHCHRVMTLVLIQRRSYETVKFHDDVGEAKSRARYTAVDT